MTKCVRADTENLHRTLESALPPAAGRWEPAEMLTSKSYPWHAGRFLLNLGHLSCHENLRAFPLLVLIVVKIVGYPQPPGTIVCAVAGELDLEYSVEKESRDPAEYGNVPIYFRCNLHRD